MISKKEIEVRYHETDQMGVIYHANYIIWCELGRIQFLHDLGFEFAELEERGILFPVHEVQVKYHSPVRFGEAITVYTIIEYFSAIRTVYHHEIKNDQGELKASAKTTVTCVTKDDFKLARLDRVAPDVYQAYKKIVEKEQ